jgi:hypothetical protein
MRDYQHEAAVALGVYLRRGREVLASMRRGELEAVQRTMLWRNAAFHNFRALDALAEGQSAELKSLLTEIQAIDDEIAREFDALRDNVEKSLGRLRRSRAKLSRYQSGSEQARRIEKSA